MCKVSERLTTPAQLALLQHLRREGKSLRKCAVVLGVSKSQVERHVSRMGVLAPRLPLTQVARMIQPYGFIYVMAARDLVKIGLTHHNVNRRWRVMKTANPWLERPLYVSRPLRGNVLQVERACHMALQLHHVTGEWFNCDRATAVAVVKRFEQEMSQ